MLTKNVLNTLNFNRVINFQRHVWNAISGEPGVKGEKGQTADSRIAIQRIEAELQALRGNVINVVYKSAYFKSKSDAVLVREIK